MRLNRVPTVPMLGMHGPMRTSSVQAILASAYRPPSHNHQSSVQRLAARERIGRADPEQANPEQANPEQANPEQVDPEQVVSTRVGSSELVAVEPMVVSNEVSCDSGTSQTLRNWTGSP